VIEDVDELHTVENKTLYKNGNYVSYILRSDFCDYNLYASVDVAPYSSSYSCLRMVGETYYIETVVHFFLVPIIQFRDITKLNLPFWHLK